MLDKVASGANTWVTENPKKGMLVVAVTVAAFFKIGGWAVDPMKDVPLTEYRVVYEHSDNYGKTCGTERGYFWYAEELSEGIFFDRWKEMKRCAYTEKQAIKTAQEIIEKRLISEKSKRKSYMAYLSKQDVVVFKDVEKND